MTDQASRCFERWLLAIVVVATLLRAPLLAGGWPYLHYVDEGNTLSVVPAMLRGERLLPDDYKYPSFPRHLMAAAAWAGMLVPGGEAPGRIPEPSLTFYENYDPPAILLSARLLVLACCLGLVWLAGRLARLVGGDAAGLATAWLAAWCPALVIRSGNVTVDPQAALLVLLALFAAEKVVSGGPQKWHWVALAAAAVGAALTTKYPAALVVLAVIYRLLVDAEGVHERVRRAVVVGGVVVVTVVVTMPGIVLDWRRVAEWIRIQSSLYTGLPTPSLASQLVSRAEWDLPYRGPELGWTLTILVLASAVAAIACRATRRSAVAWSLLAVALVAFHGRYSFQAFRNLVPAVAPALALVGVAFALLRARATTAGETQGWGGLRLVRWLDLAVVVLPVVLFGPGLVELAHERWRLVDSRVEAMAWLTTRVAPTDQVWIAPDTGILVSELRSLEATVSRLSPQNMGTLLVRGRLRFAVTPQLGADDQRGHLGDPALRRRWRLVASFGEEPGAAARWQYRGNRPRVLIFETRQR